MIPDLSLMSSCQDFRGVGPSLAGRLATLNIHTVLDLLFHLPLRYQDRTRVTSIADCRAGESVVVEGIITVNQVQFQGRRRWVCRVQDDTGSIEIRFYHFNPKQRQMLALGVRIRCFGECRYYQKKLSLVHPEYTVLSGRATPMASELTPIYPSTAGISQQKWRQLTDQALALLRGMAQCPELLSDSIRKPFAGLSIQAALLIVHRPPPSLNLIELNAGQHPAQQRLAFEELLANHLAIARVRTAYRAQSAPRISASKTLYQQFLANLPFQLTRAQQRVIDEILKDLASAKPMLRLIQGDVGSGKTIVAAISALQVIANHYQVAVMAPTELLAEQLFENLNRWFEPLNITVMALTGKVTGRSRRETLAFLATGHIDCVVGTHALFQDDVVFQQLGLVIVDEQHRFGVHQRLALHDKGNSGNVSHQLVMTATPIPRTLAMTAYANLDLSIIDELPPGRIPIITVAMSNQKREEVVARVQSVLGLGQQVYWVCTLIEESDTLQAQAASDCADFLQSALSEVTVGLIHGKLPPQKKQQIMNEFAAGDIQVLVATTVIEVGVDVPNASLMVIENAERLGLAQLHQLRGRVGRGNVASYCVLLYQQPLAEVAKARLTVMRETNDGFAIARRDLEIRGPGEVLGTKQTGLVQMRIADLNRDQALLPAVRQAATILLRDPDTVAALIQRWLADNEKYSKV